MNFKSVDLTNLGEYREDEISSPENLRMISAQEVNNIAGTAYDLYNDGNAVDDGDIFENIYLENGTKTVAQKIAEMNGDTDISPEGRGGLGSLLIAQALLENKSVVIKPAGKSMDDAIDLSADFGDFSKDNISIIDRILAWIGIKTEAIIKEEKAKAIGKFVKKSAAVKTESDALIEDSTLLTDARRPLYDKAKKEIDAERDKLNCLYFSGVGETECTNKEEAEKRRRELPHSEKFNKRSWMYMCACVMLRDGHSMENIFNPEYKPELRAEVGKEVAAIAADMASKDSKVNTQAASKLANLYLEAGKKLLELPMPSEDELFNYPASKSKTFISAIPHMAFDITQELERFNTLVLNNPRDRAVYVNLSQVGSLGAMSLPNKSMLMDFKKVPDNDLNSAKKEEVRRNVINMESTANVAKEMKFDYSGTISEVLRKNEDKLNKFQAFTNVASKEFDKEVIESGDTLPLSLEKIMNGEESVLKRTEPSEAYQRGYIGGKEMFAAEGSLKTVYERAELANNIAEKFEKVSNVTFTKDMKDKLATNIFVDANFNKLANANAEKINSYVNDQKFFTNYMKTFDTDEKVIGAFNNVKTLQAERKKANLDEDEIKKIDEQKAKKANDGPNL